ncbi:hypothetical protein LCGC14_0670190 [marine sediment metagenome]|uniref:Uncharacterized protein n=1 Tax=marine sediment metagenome TaxID=412755 RepID=A0A0F9RBB6_9ZZZZ
MLLPAHLPCLCIRRTVCSAATLGNLTPAHAPNVPLYNKSEGQQAGFLMGPGKRPVVFV